MRIDDISYQRATRVAGIGFLVQLLFGLILAVFGIVGGDDTFEVAASYVLVGTIVWLSLVVVFNQHKLERIEALEQDELQQQRMAGLGSAFDSESEEFNVAARRLRLMHKWLMPIASWFILLLLVGLGVWNLLFINTVTDPGYGGTGVFEVVGADLRGWALAICLGMAAVSFITSRFVSGMSKQPAWQNLRGGAGYMVGNALVLLAVACGIILTYFDNLVVMEWIARAICWFMFLYAAETLLNFLLNLYRPRRPGEVPRPAFDSRLLSLLSAPDSIVRSINEAINYQFGFDITSSWGYRLLVRATGKLAVFAVIVLIVLNCVVVIEPHEQAVRLRGGEIVGDRAYEPGVMLKWPWPIETAEVFDVARARALPLTAQVPERSRAEPILWSTELDSNLGVEPFIVAASRRQNIERDRFEQEPAEGTLETIESEQEGEQVRALEAVDKNFALIETEFVLHYRLKQDPEEGLLKYLRFSNQAFERRARFDTRQRSLKALALREITRYLTMRKLDEVVSADRSNMTLDLEKRIQAVFDEWDTGVQVLGVSNPWIRPAGTAAPKFEVLAFNIADREQAIADAQRDRLQQLIGSAGSPAAAEEIYNEIRELSRMRDEGASEEELAAQDERIAELLLEAGGQASEIIASARTDQWTKVLGAAARLEEFQGRRQAYYAGPRIYREFLLMDALSYLLADATKYFIVVDEDKMTFTIEMLQDSQSFVFEEGVAEGESIQMRNQQE